MSSMPTVHSGIINQVFILGFVLVYSAVVFLTTVAAVTLLFQPIWAEPGKVSLWHWLACGLSLTMTLVEYFYLLIVLKQAWLECVKINHKVTKREYIRVSVDDKDGDQDGIDQADLWYHDPTQAFFVKTSSS